MKETIVFFNLVLPRVGPNNFAFRPGITSRWFSSASRQGITSRWSSVLVLPHVGSHLRPDRGITSRWSRQGITLSWF